MNDENGKPIKLSDRSVKLLTWMHRVIGVYAIVMVACFVTLIVR